MSSLKLLVVENDETNLQLMGEVLTSLKAEVTRVRDSEQAAAMVQQGRFDGIFMDLEMPAAHGFELAGRIRESSWNRSTPIVALSGSDEKAGMREAFSKGATFFLQKPIDRQRLTRLFRAVRGTFLENRRRNVRIPLRTAVECNETHRGVTWNLSMGGMLIETGAPLKPRDSVRLSFRLPVPNEQIDAAGSVVWISATRQGIRFTRLSDQSAKAIMKFIVAAEQSDREASA
jgi:two-component system, cell cycle response regulator DivK